MKDARAVGVSRSVVARDCVCAGEGEKKSIFKWVNCDAFPPVH